MQEDNLVQTLELFLNTELDNRLDDYAGNPGLSDELIRKMGATGVLGLNVSSPFGTSHCNYETMRRCYEQVGKYSASLLSLLAVHGMVCFLLNKWGTQEQKERWLGTLSRGEKIAAFALTEPETGSDAANVKLTIKRSNSHYIINGGKKWISMALKADVFLVFGQLDGAPTAILVEKHCQGVEIRPINSGMVFRSAMLGEIRFSDVIINEDNIVGKKGFGISHIAGSGLDFGRFVIACGCVGMAQACLEKSTRYSKNRQQFDNELGEFQLIQAMLTNMIANTRAARLLCENVAKLKDENNPASVYETSIAKYFASTVLQKIAGDCIQIHGANGFLPEYGVERLYRDAKAMEIIEGTTQLQQMFIARHHVIN